MGPKIDADWGTKPLQSENGFIFRLPTRLPNHFGADTYVFVIDTFHEHQLPVRPLGMSLVLERSAQLLDGHVSVQDGIIARTAEKNNTDISVI